jgi:hypothetical protein
MTDTTNSSGMNAPASAGIQRPAGAPIPQPKSAATASGPDPIAEGLNASMTEVRAKLTPLQLKRTAVLRLVPTDPEGGVLKLRLLDAEIADLTNRLNTWADVLAQHDKEQAALREKAHREAYKDLFARVPSAKQGATDLAAEADRCMAATLDAWRAYLDHGTETWKHASAALLALQGNDPDWHKFMDANLRHTGPCHGNGPAAIATLGRFIHRLVAIVGGDAQQALHDPRQAYMAGPGDLADAAAEHTAHVVQHFTLDSE